jgi:hypothetical protein
MYFTLSKNIQVLHTTRSSSPHMSGQYLCGYAIASGPACGPAFCGSANACGLIVLAIVTSTRSPTVFAIVFRTG